MAMTAMLARAAMALGLAAAIAGCSGSHDKLPPASLASDEPGPEYVVGPLDNLQVFVWRNPEVTLPVPVRPDGRISMPLIEDLQAAGKTPTQLARDIERRLAKFIKDPVVTVMVTTFNGPHSRQIRVVGEAARPQAIAYRDNMTLLDVMVAVGGVTEFAAGNRATVIRVVNNQQKQFNVRIADLIKEGDVSANVRMLPGDVIIIPESWF
jgi:polysaccharide export outer membrane protein